MLENLQFIESLYLPDYINVVFEYCNVKYISYTKYCKWELENKIFPLLLSFPSRVCECKMFLSQKCFPSRQKKTENISCLLFPSVIPVSRLYVKYFLSQKYFLSRENISRLKNIWRGINVRVIVNFCEQQQQSMLSVISDSAKVTTVSMNEILDRLLTWGMKCRKIICGGSKKK